jgi:hypothetical protein
MQAYLLSRNICGQRGVPLNPREIIASLRSPAAAEVSANTYWGVFCRGCSGAIAFDRAPYHASGLGSAGMKPGAILCAGGHLYIYFPRDFRFFDSLSAIAEETMERNRAAYAARNPSFKAAAASVASEVASGLWSSPAPKREVA